MRALTVPRWVYHDAQPAALIVAEAVSAANCAEAGHGHADHVAHDVDADAERRLRRALADPRTRLRPGRAPQVWKLFHEARRRYEAATAVVAAAEQIAENLK